MDRGGRHAPVDHPPGRAAAVPHGPRPRPLGGRRAPRPHAATVGGPHAHGFAVGAETYSYRRLLALPREPRALYERFHAAAVECRCGNGVDDQTFVVGVELLRTTPLPADLRAAILRALALIPGIEQRAERDVLGRRGVSVAYEGSRGRQALIFDPATHELLGDRNGLGGTADLASGIVDSITARP